MVFDVVMMCTSRVVPPCVLWGLLLCLTAVGAQPRIVMAPQTTTVVVRGTTTLSCRVADKAMYTVNWIKGDKIISNGEFIISSAVPSARYSIVGDPIQGNYNLMITNILTTDNAPFRCQLRAPPSGGEDIVSDPAELIVQHPPGEGYPRCSPDFRSTTGLRVGQQVDFVCATEKGEPAAHLNWTLDDVEIPAKLTESTPGYIELEFARNVTVEDDGRSFLCTLTHELLPEPTMCEVGPLDVVFPPVDTTITPTPLVPKEGGTLILVCGAKANPITDSYTWYVTPPSPEIGDSQAIRVNRPGASLWVLNDVADEDEGTVVVCEARNSLGALNASFTIDVFKKTTPPPRPTPPLPIPTKGPPPVTPEPKSGDPLTTPYVIILLLIAAALLLLTIALVIFVVKRKKRPTQAVITVTDLDNLHADVHSLASFGNISRTGTPYLDRVDYELNRSRSHSRDMFDSVSLDSASALMNRSHSRESPTHRKYSVDSLGKPLRHETHHREYRSPSNGSPTHRPAKRLDSSPIKERKPSDSCHSQAGRPLPKITEPIQQNEYAELTPVSARKMYNQSQMSVTVTSPESGYEEDDVLIKPLNDSYPPIQSSNNCNCGRKMSHVEV